MRTDWSPVEWVLESCIPREYCAPSEADAEIQAALRKEILPKISDYLLSQEITEHLLPEYMPETGFPEAEKSVSVRRLPSWLPLPFYKSGWYELFYLESGNTTHFLADEKISLHEGDVLVIPPGVRHCPALLSGKEKEYVISVKASAVRNGFLYLKEEASLVKDFFLRSQNLLGDSGYLFLSGREKTAGIMGELMAEIRQERNSFLPYYAEMALLKLLDAAEEMSTAEVREMSLGEKLRLCIDRRFPDIEVKDMEKLFCMTGRQITAQLRKETGLGFTEYRMQARMNFVCDMLKNTRMPIGDLIACSGFFNNKAFYDLFTEQFHETPTEYRERETIR